MRALILLFGTASFLFVEWTFSLQFLFRRLPASMEPFSTASSVAGLIIAAGKIYSLLDFISSVKNSPTTISDAKNEVKHAQSALCSLKRYLNNLASLNPTRTAMIQVDDLRVTLSDAMMAFSDFETLLLTLDNIARVKAFIVWPKYAKDIEERMAKVQRYKTSLTLMLNILQSDTQLEALQSQKRLEALIEGVMHENKTLRHMMNESQDSFDAQSTFTKRQEDYGWTTRTRANDDDDTETIRGVVRGRIGESMGSGSQKDDSKKGHQSRMLRLPFERILEQSWVYKRNRRNSCDCSFISSAGRSHTWSVFSGFSLADVSILSVIAMPLTTMDLANREHYQVEAQNEGLTWPPKDFDEQSGFDSPSSSETPVLPSLGIEDLRSTWNMVSEEEEEPKDWRESNSGVEDEEAPERAHTPLSNSDTLGEDDEIRNYNPEGGVEYNDDELCQCTGCQGPLEKTEAFRLGGFHWHGNCFRCSLCGCIMEQDGKLMIQGNGTITCNDCSQYCADCGCKIEDLAVVLGPNTVVCPSCFVCFVCKQRIRDLKYARSTRGRACMACHEAMTAKKARRKAMLLPAV
ncbi:LIM zinc-binding domain-containing protein [Fusarium keratoplasticum]|uniref:LIM zinc-binding domain-containing protein n=1 Tax=Fusarium keratoplasticum TaxID=1328300 RepID=A0ACC0R0Y9_9HYPO|nr:LIM zinc-binding domain-containing protein [Fusarium keratoplasticum]KAI8671283.1 LIM zinc-binding domain-containing protein [Fusarium keratoplasticum]KAI8678515.1 LIM zinc-binding domain-containing protein [Fusarium keratoplasticum]